MQSPDNNNELLLRKIPFFRRNIRFIPDAFIELTVLDIVTAQKLAV